MLGKFGIVEIGGNVAVRYCGRLFSVMGAQVVRLASNDDDTRIGGGGDSGIAFGHWLDEKKHTARNFSDAVAQLKAAGHNVDVVIAGQSAGELRVAERMVAALPDKPLIAGITWFDPQGPYANWHGNDPIMQALSGNAYWFGPVEGPPNIAQGHMPQMLAGLNAYIAALAALWGRQTGNPVATVSASIHEAMLCFADVMIPALVSAGGKSERPGVNKGPSAQPAGIFRARDGWFGLVALLHPQWEGFCNLIGRRDLLEDPRFKAPEGRLAHADALYAIINPIFMTRTVDDLVINGQKLRVPMTHVPDQQELLNNEHWNLRESFAPVPGMANLRGPAMPFRMHHDGAKKPIPKSAPSANLQNGPLSGIRVADFSMVWAGPLAARIFADLGADVIKIESRSYPDSLRSPVLQDDPASGELNPMYNLLNRNKRNITLELKDEADAEKARALAATSDIVIENFAVGVMDKMGLGADILMKRHPGLIYIGMSAFGAEGPYNFFRAYGMTAEKASSLPFANGRAEWPPAMQHLATGDPTAGMFGAAAALIALHGRGEVGGSYMDMAQVQCVFQFGADLLITRQVTGKPLPRTGTRRTIMAPCMVVGGKDPDTWLAVAVDSDEAWDGLCRVLDRADWADHDVLSTLEGRNERADEIENAITNWARMRDVKEAVNELQKAGVAAAPVLPGHELVNDPQLLATGFWAMMERAFVGKHLHGTAPFKIDGKRPALRFPAPLLGEHTDAILNDIA